MIEQKAVFAAQAEYLGNSFRSLAERALQAELNAANSNQGLRGIYADAAKYYGAEANKFLDPLIDAKLKLNQFIEGTATLLSSPKLSTVAKAAGPLVDSAQLGISIYSDGFGSEDLGKVATGIVASFGLGLIGGLLGGALVAAGAPIAAIGVAAFGLAFAGSFFGNEIFDDILKPLAASIPDAYWDAVFDAYMAVSSFTNTAFAASQTVAPARRDPLILDLDGDGLETTGINTAAPILFDHDGDGVKTATGWVKPDDAVLVLDRNGNGTIDSGKELFGDATPLSAGGNAADGFAALAQEDSNGDGQVNASDTNFTNLRLWRDLNQDGISQTGELFTLASQGITALKVAKTSNSTFLANGNQIADLGGFVRSDGSNGTLGAVEQLADVNLASNPFYSEFTDHILLTEAAQTMADMQGAGQVRNLREAASLPTSQGNALATALTAFSAATTRSDQMAQLDSLLKTWAETSSMATTASGAFAGVNLSVTFAGVANGSPAWQAWMDKLSILERFNGQTFMPVPAAGTTLAIDFFSTREVLLDAAYTALKESVYGALVMQTRLKPYLDSVGLSVDANGIAATNDENWRMVA